MRMLFVTMGIFGIIMAALFCYERLSFIPVITKVKTILAFVLALIISVVTYMLEMG